MSAVMIMKEADYSINRCDDGINKLKIKMSTIALQLRSALHNVGEDCRAVLGKKVFVLFFKLQ